MTIAPESGDPRQVLEDLLDGKLPWERLKSLMSSPKDPQRFRKILEILQQRVPWSERILLPLGEHLYVVEKGSERIVKCDCGQEFGDVRANWKLAARIFVRDTEETLEELYPGPRKPDPRLCEVREFYCPGCGVQLEVEAVPRGYPILFDFLPDLDAFYRDWLGTPLESSCEARDRSAERIREWLGRSEEVGR
jgi:acetone carboxylase gamma subunit